ncbi:MAG TPA: hypothetical protein VMU29_10555 [Smithella sp.]|nr:hypothetical protein [Smithella sp.]
MNIKGTVIVTAKDTIIKAFGEERWKSFMAKLVAKDIFFSKMIISVTPVPVEKHIIFLEELAKEFFNNNKEVYKMFGAVAADRALSPGGYYHASMFTKDIKQFVDSALPKLWATYNDGGAVKARIENNVIYFNITGFTIKNVNYEKMLMSYYKQAIKIFGKKSVATMVRSITMGNDDILFTYELKDS